MVDKSKKAEAAYEEWVKRYPCVKTCLLLHDFSDYVFRMVNDTDIMVEAIRYAMNMNQ